MSQMSPAMEAALAGASATIFGAVQLDLPGRTVRLLSGAGVVQFTVDGALVSFGGRDAVFGTFSDIEAIDDGIGDDAPSLVITFVPASDAAVADVAAVGLQGSPVRLWLGAVNPATGLVIGNPMLVFNGLLDVATLKVNSAGRTVEYEVTSIFEDLFVADDGSRLTDGFHQYLWPGELGCSFVTYVTHQIYWGTSAPDGVTR